MASPVISIAITADDRTGRAFRSATDHADGLGSRLSTAGVAIGTFAGNLAAQAVPALLNFGQELFSLGSQNEIFANKANTVFGESVNTITSWADSVNEGLGLSDEAVVGLAASMGDLLVPMGFSRDAAADLTTQTLDAAGALSAWSGGQYDTAQVSDIMTKAMLGERDGLKALGISINQAEVDQRALAIAQAEGRDEVTAMDEALATQQLILEKSQDAQTAWADGTMDNVKAQNELKASIGDAKSALARGLVPIVQKTVKWIAEDLVPAVRELIERFRQDWPAIKAAVEPTLNWFRDTTRDVVTIVTALWDRFGSTILSYVEGAFNAIKQIVEGVMLVVKGIIDTVLGILTGDWEQAWDGIKSILEGVWTAIQGLIDGAINLIKTTLRLAWDAIGGTVSRAWDGIKTTIRDAINAVVGFVTAIPGRISNTVSGLWDGIKSGMTSAKDWVRNRLDDVVGFVTGLPGRITTAVGDLWGGFKSAATGAKDWVRDKIDQVVGIFTGLPDRMPSFSGMFDGFKSAFKAAINWIIDKWNAFEIPAVKVFGQTVSPAVGFPNIPRLAAGGIVQARSGGILANIGEGRYDEAVIPLKPGMKDGFGGTTTVYQNFPAGTRPEDVIRAQRLYERRNGVAA